MQILISKIDSATFTALPFDDTSMFRSKHGSQRVSHKLRWIENKLRTCEGTGNDVDDDNDDRVCIHVFGVCR